MGHKPALVHGVAVEPPGQLVPDAACCHATQGQNHRLERFGVVGPDVVLQKEFEDDRLGELRRSTESSERGVGPAQDLFGALPDPFGPGRLRVTLRGLS